MVLQIKGLTPTLHEAFCQETQGHSSLQSSCFIPIALLQDPLVLFCAPGPWAACTGWKFHSQQPFPLLFFLEISQVSDSDYILSPTQRLMTAEFFRKGCFWLL